MLPYVYIWHRPDGTPFYVGVGSGRRARWPLRNPLCDSIRAKIEASGGAVLVSRTHMKTREACLRLEREIIARIGRRDLGHGPLANLSDGGEQGGGASLETRAKISAARRGTKASAETRAKQSAVRKGKKQSPETIAKRVASMKGRKQSPETVAKRIATRAKNWHLSRAHPPAEQDVLDS